MVFVYRYVCLASIAALCVLSAGCQGLPSFSRMKWPNFSEIHVPSFGEIAHEFKPHRLHRWNRHAPPNRMSQWSIDDPIPKLEDGFSDPRSVLRYPDAGNQQFGYSGVGLSGLINAAAP